MTTGEVAEAFNVNAETVARWDREGKLGEGTVFRTLGGHRRYKRDRIMALLGQENDNASR